MRRRLHFGDLLQLATREQQYHNVKKGTKVCQRRNLTYGLSFYGASVCAPKNLTSYKRIEVWFPSCPTKAEFFRLYHFFNRNVPKLANTVFAYVDGQLYEVES